MWHHINEERDDKSFMGVKRVLWGWNSSVHCFQNLNMLKTVTWNRHWNLTIFFPPFSHSQSRSDHGNKCARRRRAGPSYPAGAAPYRVGVETDQNGGLATSARALFVVDPWAAGLVVYGRTTPHAGTGAWFRGGKVKRAAAGHAWSWPLDNPRQHAQILNHRAGSGVHCAHDTRTYAYGRHAYTYITYARSTGPGTYATHLHRCLVEIMAK
jgi:hypothetical protein